MGGIKNKLNKLSNKTLFKLGSRLPSFSQPSEMLTRNISNTRKPNRWSLYASKTIGSLRLVTLTKYLSIICLSLVLISTIGLNLYRTYSSSNIESNAEPAVTDSVSTTAIDPTSISISISSYPATGDSDNGNLSLSIPQGGGLVAGRHTVSVSVGSEISSYTAYLNSATEDANLVNQSGGVIYSESSSSYGMPSTGISNNSWGVALPSHRGAMYADASVYESLITNPVKSGAGSNYEDTNYPVAAIAPPNNFDYSYSIGEVKYVDGSGTTALPSVYYVVRVDNPSTILAGDYTANVVYTVVAELKAPSIDGVSPNPIRTGSSNKITLTGSNLDIVSKVTIDDRGAIRDCTSLTHSGSTKLTCTLPAISNTGSYIITAETAGGQTATTNIQVRLPEPTITSVSPTKIPLTGEQLTISGNNLLNTSQVYIDFDSDNQLDNGEECTIQYKGNGSVACMAPARSTAGGPYAIRLTANSETVSKDGVVEYVAPKPVITSVSPNPIVAHKPFQLMISGQNLSFVDDAILLELPEGYSPRRLLFACSDIGNTTISSCDRAIIAISPSFTGSLPIRIVLNPLDAANSYSFDGFLTLTNS